MRTQQCDKKACHLTTLAVQHCQIELAKPLRVTEDVDLGNLPTLTGKIRGAEQVARGALTFSRLGILRRPVLVNGVPGLVSMLEGKPFSILAFTVRDGKIAEIDILRDPERLRQLDLTVLDGEGQR